MRVPLSWLPLFTSFQWPSVTDALDNSAWDVFFALSMLVAHKAVGESRLAGGVRALMVVSGVLAFAGLSAVHHRRHEAGQVGHDAEDCSTIAVRRRGGASIPR